MNVDRLTGNPSLDAILHVLIGVTFVASVIALVAWPEFPSLPA